MRVDSRQAERRGLAQSPQSRADIQVVRAVAVLAVVAFHLDADTLPGGFLGVDVFFAISGYLISGQIISRIEAGEWSFAEFYRRRIRRLFPALFCTIVVSALFAYGLLWPDQTMDFLKSAVFAIFGASNFYFLATRDYFSPAAGLVPLLHTWSLGIEEQFYLLWPLGIFAILSTRGRPALAPIAVLFLLASLLAAAAAISRHPDEVFYLLPFRAFEFLAGALAFLWKRPIASRNVKALVAAGVWLAVAVSFFTTTSASPIAGIIAATAGTSLLLALDAYPSGGPARLLVPFRYVGDISYSLYLVHWPVVVFWRLHTGEAPGYFEMAALFVACLTLAALQYHLVEDPIRRAKTFPLGISRNIVRSFAASGLVVIALFAWGALTSGWTFRLDETQLGYLMRPSQDKVEWQYDLPACFRSGDYASVARFAEAGCIRAGAGKTNLLLLGDSTAAQFSGSPQGKARLDRLPDHGQRMHARDRLERPQGCGVRQAGPRSPDVHRDVAAHRRGDPFRGLLQPPHPARSPREDCRADRRIGQTGSRPRACRTIRRSVALSARSIQQRSRP